MHHRLWRYMKRCFMNAGLKNSRLIAYPKNIESRIICAGIGKLVWEQSWKYIIGASIGFILAKIL